MLSKYYSGSGDKVMRKMKRRYGKAEGQRTFYAKANQQKRRKGSVPR